METNPGASSTGSERDASIASTLRDVAVAVFTKRDREHKQRPHSAHHLIAGISAGIVTTAALYPLDLVKTRYQVYDRGLSPYKSIRAAFQAIVKNEGPKALYQGLGPALTGNAVAWGGFFYCYEGAKRIIRDSTRDRDLGAFHHLSAGFAAGVTMVFATNPVWMVKTRMQLQDKAAVTDTVRLYTSSFDAVRTIVREEGVIALYSGVVPALLLCGQGAVQFMVYEWLKARVPRHDENTPLESLIMGAGSKVVSSLVTYPTQVIKSRLQQRATEMEIKTGTHRYRGTWHCAVSIAQAEGIRGFFKGCVAYALRAAPASAVTFVVYEEAIKLLSKM